MKKFISMAIMMIAAVLMFSSCAHKSGNLKKVDEPKVDSSDIAYVQACLDQMQTPEWTDPNEAMSSFIKARQDAHTDSVIQSIPIAHLERMCSVVADKYGVITPELVAKEYDESYDKVYKHLSGGEYSAYEDHADLHHYDQVDTTKETK